MVTTGANDSKPNESQYGGQGRKPAYKGRQDSRPYNRENRDGRPGERDSKPGERDTRPVNREYNKPGSKDYKPASRDYKPASKDARPASRDSKPYNRESSFNKDQRSTGPYKPRDNRGGGMYNKDRDFKDGNESRYNKGNGGGRDQRMKDVSPAKEKEQQPDKLETKIRFEKEKKTVEKKKQVSIKKAEKPARTPVKQRRTNNIDWTKGFANGLYDDDDEDYTMLL